jgi:diacylglycerol O-acyltransferase / trehalose O-mycolyltransferase
VGRRGLTDRPRPAAAIAVVAVAAALLTGCGGGSADRGAGDGGGDRDGARPAATADGAATPAATASPGADAREGAGAAVVATRRAGARELDLTIRSPALGRTARVRLLTPAGWRRGAGRRWPVLFLLPGCCSSYRDWSRNTDIAELAALRRVLVVMPEGGAVGFYSDWRRGRPGWETFHTLELPVLLGHGYGAGKRRAVAGLSMGGLGAMGYAARHPGMFRAAASFSGALHPLQHPDFWLGLFAVYTGDKTAIWGDPVTDRARWRAHDPTVLAGRLRGTALFVSAGNGRPGPFDPGRRARDPIEPTISAESQAFVARAKAAGLAVRADFYGPGTHRWAYWQRELHRALPLLLGPIT